MARVVAPLTPRSTKSASAAFAIATCLAGFGPRRPIVPSSSECHRATSAIRARRGPELNGVLHDLDDVVDGHGRRQHGSDRAILLARQLDSLFGALAIDSPPAQDVTEPDAREHRGRTHTLL